MRLRFPGGSAGLDLAAIAEAMVARAAGAAGGKAAEEKPPYGAVRTVLRVKVRVRARRAIWLGLWLGCARRAEL